MIRVNVASCELEDGVDRGAFWHRESSLGERLGAKWIAPAALVLGGTPTLRHPDSEDVLDPGALVCFAEGPVGAHRLLNHGKSTARLISFSTPIGRPTSTFYPDDKTVVIRVPGHRGYRFSLEDQVDDYWDGEPGAAIRGSRC